MTRIRINNVFKKFLSEFHHRTVRDSNITSHDLKIKYLATLEGLTSGLGSEVFEPVSLIVAQEGEGFNGGYYGKIFVTSATDLWHGCGFTEIIVESLYWDHLL